MSIRRLGSRLALIALLVVTIFNIGCVTNGRQVLLKEYGPSVPVLADAPLQGKTVCLKGFETAPNLTSLELKEKPEEPSPFKYMDLSRDQDKLWSQEMKALRKKTNQMNWREIGNMRNGFGMVMSHVHALNDPATWMLEGLKYDLEAQGAKVVEASQAATADVTVSGTIQLCRADMYMTIDASILVDLDVQPKQGEARHRQVHTHGATAAMMASEGEYFHALRDARQKFSIIATREIIQAVKAAK